MTEIADDEYSQDYYKSTETKSEIKLNTSRRIDTTYQDQTLQSADFANVSKWGSENILFTFFITI